MSSCVACCTGRLSWTSTCKPLPPRLVRPFIVSLYLFGDPMCSCAVCLLCVQGLLDKHGRENDKTPKGWKEGYHDLTPKSVKAAKAAGGGAAEEGGEGGENGAAATAAAGEAASPEGEKKKKKKKKDKVGRERGTWPPLLVRACVCV